MDGVILTPLKIIHGTKGNVLHAMKASDSGYNGFGEAYFSTVKYKEIKGWKRHNKMTLNLIVPQGEIEFILHDGINHLKISLSCENYQRLTVSPGLWMAFRGVGENLNLLLNIANIPHGPEEFNTKDLSELNYE